MTSLVMQLNCNFTDSEKESCIPTIERLIDLSKFARMEGILALELEAQHMTNPFLKTGLFLIVDGIDPGIVKQILQNLILADKYSGSELLDRLLMAEGLLSIQQGENTYITTIKLCSMLGEKYMSMVDEIHSVEGERMKKYLDFVRTFADKKPLPESEPFESIFLNLDSRSLQTVLGAIEFRERLAMAIKGCRFELVRKVLVNVSFNVCIQICEDLETFGSLRNEDILESQEKIIKIYETFVEQGIIIPYFYTE